jgi:uncharacterized protein YfiM (DUF2279 family)
MPSIFTKVWNALFVLPTPQEAREQFAAAARHQCAQLRKSAAKLEYASERECEDARAAAATWERSSHIREGRSDDYGREAVQGWVYADSVALEVAKMHFEADWLASRAIALSSHGALQYGPTPKKG